MWIEDIENIDTQTGKVISVKYRYVERFKDPNTGKKRRVSLTHSKKNARVEKEMPGLLKEKFKKIIEEESYQEVDEHMIFGELCDMWLDVYKDTVKNTSYKRAKNNINSIKEALGEKEVNDSLASDINRFFLQSLQSERYVYNSAKQIKSNIDRVLKFGKTYYDIQTENIISRLEVPKINVTKKNNYNYLEKSELKKIIKHFKKHYNPELSRLILLQANTGMRFGEMVSLDYKTDIDFSQNSINIEKTYDYDKKTFTSPKSGDERVIYFNKDIAKILREQILHTQLLTMGRSIEKENTLLFKSIHGNVVLHRALNSKFPEVDLEKDVTTHTLRHTFISMAVEKGISRELIAKQVGHSDNTMIDEIYAHFTDGMKEQQKRAMLDFKII